MTKYFVMFFLLSTVLILLSGCAQPSTEDADEIARLENDNQILQDRVTELEANITVLEQQNDALETTNAELQNKLGEQEIKFEGEINRTTAMELFLEQEDWSCDYYISTLEEPVTCLVLETIGENKYWVLQTEACDGYCRINALTGEFEKEEFTCFGELSCTPEDQPPKPEETKCGVEVVCVNGIWQLQIKQFGG